MQDAVRLHGARIDRHRAAQPVLAGPGDDDAEVGHQRVGGVGVDGSEIDGSAESHGVRYPREKSGFYAALAGGLRLPAENGAPRFTR
ncbi:hypothetical protein D9M69_730800 [compost metagenome]